MDAGGKAAAMTMFVVLAVMAIAQSAFLLILAGALAVNRSRARHDRASIRRAAEQVAGPLGEWLVNGGSPETLVAAFRGLRENDAPDVLLRLASMRVPREHAAELAAALREEPWAVAGLARARSRFWWRRLQAARLLAFVGLEKDRALLEELLRDSNPSVQLMAGGAIARIGGPRALVAVMDHLPERSRFHRLQQFAMLKEQWQNVAPLLLMRLEEERDPKRLTVWIALADAVGTFDLYSALCNLGDHPDAEIRRAVARALRNCFHPLATAVLVRLAADPAARVRARAAQSLGSVGATDAIAPLAALLVDRDWAVRFRTAVSLAQLGEAGREALRAARSGTDRFAADIAATVTGLSVGALNEMAEG